MAVHIDDPQRLTLLDDPRPGLPGGYRRMDNRGRRRLCGFRHAISPLLPRLYCPRQRAASESRQSVTESVKQPKEETQRLDKWLWVARFFKTRGLAATAISGGKVQVGGERVKPSRHVGPGTQLEIRRGPTQWRMLVRGIARHRRPAPEAALLYEETPESIEQREGEAERRKLEAGRRRERLGKPSKRARRDATRLKSGRC